MLWATHFQTIDFQKVISNLGSRNGCRLSTECRGLLFTCMADIDRLSELKKE